MDQYIFQWSIKLDNGEIYVIHSNSINDLKLKREELMIFINSLKTRKEIDSVPIQDELKDVGESIIPARQELKEHYSSLTEDDYTPDGPSCKVHDEIMKPNKNGKLYHREFKEGKVRFCNGFAWSEWK